MSIVEQTLPHHRDHRHRFQNNRFVYPVVSRRSSGLSIGVNLNPDRICNFDCIYCQIDRRSESETRFVEMERLLAELDEMLSSVAAGTIWQDERFASVPEHLRRCNDIAFSGEGEPTTFKNFAEIVAQVAALKSSHGLDGVKLVLITNASMLHREHVRQALEILDRNNGEIWAKLDAGTDAYYQMIERTKVPFQRILDNITHTAQIRPIVIQSIFMRVQGEPPAPEEIDAYIGRLKDVLSADGKIRLVQVYTVARRPAESYVEPLSNAEVDAIADRVRRETGLPTAAFYG